MTPAPDASPEAVDKLTDAQFEAIRYRLAQRLDYPNIGHEPYIHVSSKDACALLAHVFALSGELARAREREAAFVNVGVRRNHDRHDFVWWRNLPEGTQMYAYLPSQGPSHG